MSKIRSAWPGARPRRSGDMEPILITSEPCAPYETHWYSCGASGMYRAFVWHAYAYDYTMVPMTPPPAPRGMRGHSWGPERDDLSTQTCTARLPFVHALLGLARAELAGAATLSLQPGCSPVAAHGLPPWNGLHGQALCEFARTAAGLRPKPPTSASGPCATLNGFSWS